MSYRTSWFAIATLIGTGVILHCSSLLAQVVADPSLGSNVTLNGNTFEITNGTIVGGRNLFHSLSRFDVPSGGTASFLNPPAIVNIFARVTGGTASNIQGTIQAQGTANLFLLNPQGMLFGPNAQLNLSGSFIATSATGVQFPGGARFAQTTAVDRANLLLAVDPSALLFNQLNPGPIQNRSTAGGVGLSTPDRSLLLVGGAVVVEGGILFAPNGRIELAALAAPGQVDLTRAGNLLGLTVPLDTQTADITLTDGAILATTDNPNGGIGLTGRQISLRNNSIANGLQRSGITVRAEQLTLQANSFLTTTTANAANAGSIQIQVADTVNVVGRSGIVSFDQAGATGSSGDINLTARRLLLDDRGSLISSTTGVGQAGMVTIRTTDTVEFTNNSLLSASTNGSGNGGNLLLETGVLKLANNSGLLVGALGAGNSGTIAIRARDRIEASQNSLISTLSLGSGNAGDLTLDTAQLSLQSGSFISADTGGSGNGGNVTIRATEAIDLVGQFSLDDRQVPSITTRVGIDGTGNGGNLQITTRQLRVRGGGSIATTTFGPGQAGNLTIRATDLTEVSGRVWVPATGLFAVSELAVGSGFSSGNGGRLTLETGVLNLTDNALITASTAGRGNGGTIDIQAAQVNIQNANINALTNGSGKAGDISLRAAQIHLDQAGIAAQVRSGASGQGGTIVLEAQQLQLQNGSQVNNSTFGAGQAGNLTIRANQVVVAGQNSQGTPSGLFAGVGAGAFGQGGNLRIEADQLLIRDGGLLSTQTLGSGNAGNLAIVTRLLQMRNQGAVSTATTDTGDAGNLTIRAHQVELDGSDITASTRSDGRGGTLILEANQLTAQGGSQIGVSTFGAGNAGSLVVRANRITLAGEDPQGFITGLYATVNPGASGRGGTLQVEADRLQIWDGALISTSTSGAGDAGNLTVQARDIELAGTDRRGFYGGIGAEVARGATGQGGDLTILGDRLTVRDGAGITAGSQGQGRAGSLAIGGNLLLLDKQAFISATTDSGQGGNLTFDLRQGLVLRRNSTISTTAGQAQAGGDGGNITITTPFVLGVARENSDITANAFTGRGGNIQITAQGIYGLQFRPQLTPLSDITASSQFGISGVVSLNTPDVDPSRGLVQLPASPVDPANQIAQECQTGVNQLRSSFLVKGRGGLPIAPDQPLQSSAVLADWADLAAAAPGRVDHTEAIAPLVLSQPETEAEALTQDREGNLWLVASTAISHWYGDQYRCQPPN